MVTDGFYSDDCEKNVLIEKAKKGSSDAFESLMNNHLKIIYNYIASRVSNSEDVKDIVQETMLAVWNNIKLYENNSSFKTWVLGITRRKIADYYRTSYKNSAVPLSELEECLSAKDEFENVENSIVLESTKNVLGKTEKEIVFLIFNAQLSYTEISDLTNIPVGTIKSKMSTIKAKLKKQIG